MLDKLSVGLGLLWFGAAAAAACPGDPSARAPEVLLSVQWAGRPGLALTADGLAALPQTRLTQTRAVSSGAASATEQSIVYSGVLLRDAVAAIGFPAAADRSARTGIVEAVATDGYRAVFSWGELFNSAAAEQTLVITAQNGQSLGDAAGPLALRALADLRPGPRHVRNLCALRVLSP